MARKIFSRIGLRRDFNFSDLSDPKEALNNLLDTLIDDVNSTFISEDLDAIRNVFAEGLNNDGYQKLLVVQLKLLIIMVSIKQLFQELHIKID